MNERDSWLIKELQLSLMWVSDEAEWELLEDTVENTDDLTPFIMNVNVEKRLQLRVLKGEYSLAEHTHTLERTVIIIWKLIIIAWPLRDFVQRKKQQYFTHWMSNTPD